MKVGLIPLSQRKVAFPNRSLYLQKESREAFCNAYDPFLKVMKVATEERFKSQLDCLVNLIGLLK